MTITLGSRVLLGSLGAADDGKEVVVAGWVEEVRDLGGIAFLKLRDGTGAAQVVLPKKKLDAALVESVVKANRESVMAVKAKVQRSEKARAGYELFPLETQLLNAAETPLPLPVADPVPAELDTRLDNRFLDLRKPEIQAIFRVRSEVLAALRDDLREQGFTEIHTPRIIAAASEGGTELFPVQYFEKQAYLAQSPQLYKQMMMASGLDRVFEVATYFRAESHNTVRHLNEITAVDVELAFVDSEEDVLRVLERIVAATWKRLAGTCGPLLDARKVALKVPALPFPRVPYDEAVGLVKERGIDVPWGEDLSREAEKALGDVMLERGHEFYFITRYPEACKPFYAMPDGKLSRSFDLEFKGMEITSGAQRIHQKDVLEKRMQQKGLDPTAFEMYLKAFRFGMPPHGGFGLGIERLVLVALGLDNIREAVLFPRDRTRLTP